MPMAKEADFYSAEEAAKVLGIPVRRVFGMLCSGELEGRQDEWARWHVPASAVQGARRSLELSSSGELPEEDAESRPVSENETRVLDAAATNVLANGGPLWEPPLGDTDSPGGEETTQEAGEALISGSPALSTSEESSDAETTEGLPRGDHQETTASDEAPDEAIQELVEQLAAAAAKTRELRDRLEFAEATESALRESLEREHQRADHESSQAESQHKAATEQPEEELTAGRDEGFWRGVFRG